MLDLPAKKEEEQEPDHNDCQDDPSYPGIPCGLTIAPLYTVLIVASCLSHDVSDLCG